MTICCQQSPASACTHPTMSRLIIPLNTLVYMCFHALSGSLFLLWFVAAFLQKSKYQRCRESLNILDNDSPYKPTYWMWFHPKYDCLFIFMDGGLAGIRSSYNIKLTNTFFNFLLTSPVIVFSLSLSNAFLSNKNATFWTFWKLEKSTLCWGPEAFCKIDFIEQNLIYFYRYTSGNHHCCLSYI